MPRDSDFEPKKQGTSDVPRGSAHRYDPYDLCVIHDRKTVLTKIINRKRDGSVDVSGYSHSRRSVPELVATSSNIRELSRILMQLEDEPSKCVIRAQPKREFYDGSRIRRRYAAADDHYEERSRAWVMIDVDKIELPDGMRLCDGPKKVTHWVLDQLDDILPGIAGVTVHVQLSSSAGLRYIEGHADHGKAGPEKISMHVWAILDKAYSKHELARWCDVANARYGSKVIDRSMIMNLTQPNYTAAPVFRHGVEEPLSRRSFLIEGERDVATPVIPDDKTFERVVSENGGSGVLPSGRTFREYAGMIGDYGIEGKQGFQEPIKMACFAAVDEQGEGVDIGAVTAVIRKAVSDFRGERTPTEIARYSDAGFTRDKIKWALRSFATKKQVAQQRLLSRAKSRTDEDDDVLTLADARRDLRRKQEAIFVRSLDHTAMHSLFEDRRSAAKLQIANALTREGYAEDTEEREREFHSRQAKAVGDIKADLADEFGLEHYPDQAPCFLNSCSLGLGKTSGALKLLAQQKTGTFDVYARDHVLMQQSYDDLVRLNPHLPVWPIRGRSQIDPEGRLIGKVDEWAREDDKMCPRHEAVKDAAETGLSPHSSICEECPLRDHCGYLKQFEGVVVGGIRQPGIVVLPHAFLPLDRRTGTGDVVVIDENPTSSLVSEVEFSDALLTDRQVVAQLATDHSEEGKCRRAMQNLAQLLIERELAPKVAKDAWPWRGGEDEHRQKVMRRVARGLMAAMEGRKSTASLDADDLNHARRMLTSRDPIELSGNMPDREIRAAVARVGRGGRKIMRTLVEQARLCRKRHIEIGSLVSLDERGERNMLTVFTPPTIPAHVPVIVLDATANPLPLERMFDRDFEIIDIRMDENVRVTQVYDVTGSKSSLFGRDARHAFDKISKADKAKQFDKVRKLIDAAVRFSDGKEVLFVAQKETIDTLAREGFGAVPESLHTAHFGALRGQNAFKDLRHIVIAGRMLPPVDALERMAAAVFARLGDRYSVNQLPMTVKSWCKLHDDIPEEDIRADGCMDRNGNPWHPGTLTEALRYDACEAEIVQAVGRLRSIAQDEPCEVLLIGELTLDDLPEPERLMPYRQFIQTGRTGASSELYEDRCEKPCLAKGLDATFTPFGAPDMAAIAPDLFRNEKAAKNARVRQLDEAKNRKPPRGEWRRECGKYWVDGRYDRRGSSFGAWVRRGVNDTVGAVTDAAEFMLGRRLRKIMLRG